MVQSFDRNTPGAARGIYRLAEKWRSFTVLVALVLGLIALISSVNSAQTFGEFDGGSFLLNMVISGLIIAVLLMPYFMMVRVLQGVGSVVEEASQIRADRDRLREAAGAPATAGKGRGSDRLSPEARRVLSSLGELGSATYGQVAKHLDVDTAVVDQCIHELIEAGLVDREPGGTYSATAAPPTAHRARRPSPPSRQALSGDDKRVFEAIESAGRVTLDRIAELTGMYPGNVWTAVSNLRKDGHVLSAGSGMYESAHGDPSPGNPEMVYCETCRYPVSVTLAAGPHKGHKTRPM